MKKAISKYSIEVISFDEDTKVHQFTAREGYYVNSAIIETKNNLVLYDAQQSHQYGCEFRKYCNTLKKTINRIIIGHPHIDHYAGLTAFADIPVYSTSEIIADFKQANTEEKYYPKHILEDSFEVDDLAITSIKIKNAHCPNLVAIMVKDLKTAIVGDIARYKGHLLAYDFRFFIQALELLNSKKDEYKYLIAGHGSLTKFSTIEENLNYLKKCYEIYQEVKNKEELDQRINEYFVGRSKILKPLWHLLKDKEFRIE